MSDASTTIDSLSTALEHRDADVIGLAWDAFDAGLQLADALAWQPGTDDLQALAAAEACTAGRALLPPPAEGRPVRVGDAAQELGSCTALLERVHQELAALAAAAADPHEAEQLAQAAGQAAAAARTVAAIREN